LTSAADLILATSNDVQAIVSSDFPLGSFKGVNVDGLDPLKLAALHALLSAKAFADQLRDYQPMAQASPAGPWLVRLPAELILLLGKIAPTDQSAVAVQWAATDQARQDDWTAEVAESLLGRLVPFAHNAAFEGQDLFLWIYN